MTNALRPFILLSLAATTIGALQADDRTAWKGFYDQAPAIRIVDPQANLVGSVIDGNNTLIIRLTDVALYSGHVCPNVAAGYIGTSMALNLLYPEDTPVRGQIRVASAAPNGICDLASYITGARAFYGRQEINGNDLVIDPALKPSERGRSVLIFQRKDTGRAVRLVVDKGALISPEQQKHFHAFHEAVGDGSASEEEKTETWLQIQMIVKSALLSPPEGMLDLTVLDNYEFPAAPDNEQNHGHHHH